MGSCRITYAHRLEAPPEAEISALASVYEFVLACHAKKEAVPDRRPNDEKERFRNAFLASTNYTK